ncbi:uncharacterized protein LOC125677748 isoform X4 [Ostrea edulis]|uniref:uncharacterized protein LOC125677748 isoform X4 n=1 Tax=Ostrea edulis TaxID=37623 RepID=UPI0024AEE415|nr:uncharacterized protein LOC125677748 isoform X4 [Ostrea edulis]
MQCISCVLISLGLVAVLTTDIGYGHEDSWQLVFHAVQGNGESVLDAWNTKSPSQCTPNNGCLPPGFKLDHWRDNAKHLRSPLIDQWESFSIKKIRVELGGQGKTLAFLEFDGSGSNNKDWFSKSRLLHSSWSDLKTANTNYFSIEGYLILYLKKIDSMTYMCRLLSSFIRFKFHKHNCYFFLDTTEIQILLKGTFLSTSVMAGAPMILDGL